MIWYGSMKYLVLEISGTMVLEGFYLNRHELPNKTRHMSCGYQ